jgi:hypothetical protein
MSSQGLADVQGHIPQPDNFTTCGKLGIEINQYNCPIEVTTPLSNTQRKKDVLLLPVERIHDIWYGSGSCCFCH